MRSAVIVGFLCACLSSGTPLAGSQALSIRVSPAVAREPALLRVVATIEPDERNRTLQITVASDGYTRSSAMQLDGINARRIWETELRNVPQGNYEVTAIVDGTNGRRATASRVVIVMP